MVCGSAYVAAEERALMELAGSLAAGETWRPMEDAAQTHVLHSASQLFGAIKKSLQRCARFVSRGEAMLRLMAAFQARRGLRCPVHQHHASASARARLGPPVRSCAGSMLSESSRPTSTTCQPELMSKNTCPASSA